MKKPSSHQKRRWTGKRRLKVFISHSSRDASFVTLIVELLKTSTLKEDEIRCTSVDGYGVPTGERVAELLRRDIETCDIIIAVLTKDALKSLHVLLELGAGWGLEKRLVPIRGPGVELSGLPLWLSEKHCMPWDHEQCWYDFDPDVFRKLGKRLQHPKKFKGIVNRLVTWQWQAPQPGSARSKHG